MCKNFGQTQQNLRNFRLPPIAEAKGYQGQQPLMGVQTDILDHEVVNEAGMSSIGQLNMKKGAGILKKNLTQATKSYQPKYKRQVKQYREKEDENYYIPMAKPIKEGDLN